MKYAPGLRPRNGVSLIELAVVAAIFSILVGIIIPSIQTLREAARRVECENNQKQIGLGLQAFHSAWGHFPGSPETPFSRFSRAPGSTHSLFIELLPFMEQNAFYEDLQGIGPLRFNWASPMSYDAKFGVVAKAILECPSDAVGIGSNYRGCTGPGIGRLARPSVYGEWGLGEGTFTMRRATSMKDFRRGSSNTVMISEKRRGAASERYVLGGHIWISDIAVALGGYENVTIDKLRAIATAEGDNVLQPVVTDSGRYWWVSDYKDALYNHTTTPNERLASLIIVDGNGRGMYVDGGLVGATSSHPGCVITTFGDGSVRTITDGIDRALWSKISALH